MFGRLIGAAALVLACGVAPAKADCGALAHVAWTKGVSADAMSQGPTCENAIVTLVLRDSAGKPIWVDSRIGAQVMTFAGVKNRAEMTKALSEWVDQKNAMMPRSDKLPDWPKGADAPQAGEFPFYPESEIDREGYLKIRTAHVPMFCYVQGMESMACVALTPDGVTKVGVQTFPG